ncbi:hypothetical protein [Pedobacter sp.]|uniref:hypothetical protein n=1 Tax=Pedobacter sp. TaxID=1411316 RepID=UPI00396C8B64
MKTLIHMNNVEKGKLLADLFPNELLGVINYIRSTYENLKENEEEIRENWETNLITVDLWFTLADDVNSAVKTNGKKLLKSRCFSDQLFDGYCAIFTIDCIAKYAEKERKNSSFYHLVNALFNLDI